MSRKNINKLERIETVLSAAYAKDYKEIPVSMGRFLRDENFLGKITGGGKTVYPLWKRVLSDIAIDDSKYLIVLTGAIGIGKTVTAVTGIAYGMYRVLCVDGNSTVYDCEKKKWVKLSQAYKNGLNYTLSVDESGNVGAYKVDRVIFSGRKPVYEVVVKYAEPLFKRRSTKIPSIGRCKIIKTSLDHRFWTKDGWKPLKDISVGDQVLVYGDHILVPREEKSGNISGAVKKIWESRTKEERYEICEPGMLKMHSIEGKTKANKTRESKEYRDKISRIRQAYLDSLSLEEKKERTKHFRTPVVRDRARDSLVKYWANLSSEEKEQRVLKRLCSMDWDEWRKIMEVKVWKNPRRNKKLSKSTSEYMRSLSPEELEERIKALHTSKAIAKAVSKRKEWWRSLSQEEKNEIVEKMLKTAYENGTLGNRSPWGGYGKRCKAVDGHICDSKLEKKVDDWFTENNVEHTIHVVIRNNGVTKSVDFFTHGWYIEVDGLSRSDAFFEEKLKGLPYVVVRPKDKIEEKLGFLTKYTNSNFAKTLFGKVISIEYVGEKLTYDVVMDDDSPKNFICRGVVVHNCLKSPWEFFEKHSGGKLAIMFFNLTKSLSHSKGFNLLQSYILSSSWFRAHGQVVGTEQNPRIEFPIFEYMLASPYSKGFGVEGADVLFGIMDEVDSDTESEKQKIRVLQAYESSATRQDSRFVRISDLTKQAETLGRFFLCASKQEQLSFLNTFIVKMKNSPTVYIVDASLWEVKTDLNLSGKKFPIMLGDPYTPSKILGIETENGFEIDTEGIENAEKMGFEIIQVPIEYLERFQKDLVGNLRRLAGVSVDQLRKSKLFPSEKMIVDCYDPAKRDPVTIPTIEVGLNDDVDFAKFIDFSAIRIPRNYPRYIHVDIAYSGNGDALGLGMSCISGWTDRTVEDLEDGGTIKVEKLPVVETDLCMRIKGRPGDKIPLSKVRKLIVDLKKVYNFNIRLVTFDLDLLSEESKQILTRVGINCDSLSLDKNPQIYREFRNLVADKRWCCHRNDWLHFELANLEDDHEKNRVDHPSEVIDMEILGDGSTRDIVVKGSKDCSDGTVGSVENALRGAEAPMGKEFTKMVTGVLSRPVQRGAPGSLLSIPKGATIIKGGEKERDVAEDRIPKKFGEIFRRSQGR